MRKGIQAVFITLLLVVGLLVMRHFLLPKHIQEEPTPTPQEGWQERPIDQLMLDEVSQNVQVSVQPAFNYSFAIMEEGVYQHLDREYTYDVVPDVLVGGFLFQGIHRPPAGTHIEFELKKPATVYFFFHPEADGGYTEIFARLADWELLDIFPQYDIYNGDHGLEMIMYKLEAMPGRYSIPATTADRACFNIVYQFHE